MSNPALAPTTRKNDGVCMPFLWKSALGYTELIYSLSIEARRCEFDALDCATMFQFAARAARAA